MSIEEGRDEEPDLGWYADGTADIEQGDILTSFNLVTPIASKTNGYEFARKSASVIVLTQSCDVPKPKQTTLMVAEVHDYKLLVSAGEQHLKDKTYKQALARGSAISDFLLPPSPGSELSWSIVSFRDIFVVPKALVLAAAETDPPLRLMSPYREYLSQAFARSVMRVGLPANLSIFEGK